MSNVWPIDVKSFHATCVKLTPSTNGSKFMSYPKIVIDIRSSSYWNYRLVIYQKIVVIMSCIASHTPALDPSK